MKVFIDVETVPDNGITGLKVHESMYTKLDQVPDISEVKPDGRLKDPEAIATSKETRLQALREEYEVKKSDMFSSFALSPLTGKIVCYSILVTDGDTTIADVTESNKNEIRLLQGIEDIITRAGIRVFSPSLDRVITFNGNSFDIPYIIVRSAINKMPTSFSTGSKYDLNHRFDIRSALTNFDNQMKGTLAQWCLAFGIEYDDSVSGRDIYGLWKTNQSSVVEAKCRQDRNATIELYNSIERYYR